MKKMYTYPDAEVVIFASADNTNLISNATVNVGVVGTDKLQSIKFDDLKK